LRKKACFVTDRLHTARLAFDDIGPLFRRGNPKRIHIPGLEIWLGRRLSALDHNIDSPVHICRDLFKQVDVGLLQA
jgi:hypothetical protein